LPDTFSEGKMVKKCVGAWVTARDPAVGAYSAPQTQLDWGEGGWRDGTETGRGRAPPAARSASVNIWEHNWV